MNIQIIKSINGQEEYVLLPIAIYKTLHDKIDKLMAKLDNDYVAFNPSDYIENPIALARIKTGMTQKELADRMGVTQEYISKIENQDKVTAKLMIKVKAALTQNDSRRKK